MDTLRIRMLGEFSLQYGDKIIFNAGNRSKKVWNLLAYLIYNRNHSISQHKLIDLLWGADDTSINPENAMRITLYRVRALLDQLWDGAGRMLVIHRDGGYGWNTAFEITLDYDQFSHLIQIPAKDEEQRLKNMLDALKLYQGTFLPKQASETWVTPVSTHFHELFLYATLETAGLLSTRGRHQEAAQVCWNAITTEPYYEPLYQRLIHELSAMGDLRGAVAVYERLTKYLSDDLGIQPSEETRAIYRNITLSPKDRPLLMEELAEDLQEADNMSGAMQCDYDYFRVLCFAKKRFIEHTGNETHIALLTLSNGRDNAPDKDAIAEIMDHLGTQLRQDLRRCDVISRCSTSQYIIMLYNANYENSCKVCEHIIAAYLQKHAMPQDGSKINYNVWPLASGMLIP